jgi:hypothetical protein
MINMEFHKGQTCLYKPIFCQEGYCSECQQGCTTNTENKLQLIGKGYFQKNISGLEKNQVTSNNQKTQALIIDFNADFG